MRVLSTNVGKPKSYTLNGVTVESSMRRDFAPNGLNIYFDRVEGDLFSVPKFHGIKEAVVYAFAASTFPEFSRLYGQTVGAGNVGENLTLETLDESSVVIGDEYDIGSARLRATGPRFPCNRLNFCFQREDAMALFMAHRRPGVYFEVVREGHIDVGDVLKLVKSAGGDISVLDLYDALVARKDFAAGRISAEKFATIKDRILSSPQIAEVHRAKFR